MMPNFLVIGSARSGTTSLYHHLKQHPEIYVTPVLEPRFFAFENSQLDFRGAGDYLLRQRVITRREEYAALFNGVGGEKAIGEVTPAYLSSDSAPERIFHHIPEAKIIAILRNPVERAISSFRLEVLEGFETITDLSLALAAEASRIANNWSYVCHYKRRGFYYIHLKRYFDLFPRENLKIFLYEDWRNGIELLQGVFRFLGVNPTLGIPKETIRCNTTAPSCFRERGIETPRVTGEARASLATAYRDDIERLQTLIDRDLSAWLMDSTERE